MQAIAETVSLKPENEKAAQMWGSGGRAYDEISRGISYAIEHAVARLAPKPGERVLDLATGTGWAARRVARLGGRVTAVDISEGMLTAARQLASEEALEIEFQIGEAERLDFADGLFDGVISTFGVMFAPDQEAAVAELARVCRPGGRLAVVAWPADSNAVTIRQRMAPFMPPPPSTPSPSPYNWGDRDWLQTALGETFEIAFEEGEAIHRLPDAETAWQVYEAGFGPVRLLASVLEPARRDELRQVFMDWANESRDGVGLSLRYEYLMTFGRRR